ncbi:MAG: AAA family ATPase [Planctomycetes bacterium]|nr:AAA family ATPase [Planctomycetota bacterium]
MASSLDFNEQFRGALELMQNSAKNIFITGKAGTGKSTLLDYFRNNTAKNIAVTAPTGVAAVNVKGVTLHSFCRFRPGVTPHMIDNTYKVSGKKNFYNKLDAIIIDEVSMVRADLLDCLDKFLRLNGRSKTLPFAGIQMIFIGDLYQLPPVVRGEERKIFEEYYESPYFFSSKVFKELSYEFVELIKVYRQKDGKFIGALNSVRNNTVTPETLETLNSRYDPDFVPAEKEFHINLTTTNQKADEINAVMLTRQKGKEYSYEAAMEGDFDQKSCPADEILKIKIGSQIMLVNNDNKKRWVNGTVGKIVKIIKQDGGKPDKIIVKLNDGENVEVLPFSWELFKYKLDEETDLPATEVIGSFTQYPLILAWAITIHKSQGKTFDKVVVDLERGSFAHGQTYVALSRCTSLEGLTLKQNIQKRHILMDWRVVKFLTGRQYRISEDEISFKNKIEMIRKAIDQKKKCRIVYLKASDETSERIIDPLEVSKMRYNGKNFTGLEGYCHLRMEKRVFRIDRILKISVI